MRVFTVTDPDSTEGLPEAYAPSAECAGLRIIPGIELSTDIPQGEIHMLGYFLDWKRPALQDVLQEFRASRADRGLRMIQKLNQLGMHITWEQVMKYAQEGAVGRPHVAQALLEQGYVSS